MPSDQDFAVLAGMTLGGADVADAAMFVIVVVPTHEQTCPLARFQQVRKPFGRGTRGDTWRCGTGTRQTHSSRLPTASRSNRQATITFEVTHPFHPRRGEKFVL